MKNQSAESMSLPDSFLGEKASENPCVYQSRRAELHCSDEAASPLRDLCISLLH